jgi:AAHS family 3-hydroxyphenylpropionic acid transporter
MSDSRPKGLADGSMITVGLCFLAAVFEGVDLQAAGVAAPRLGPLFHLSAGQLGWFFSSATFGLLIGSALGGWASDWVGRKTVLIGSLIAFGLMSIANAFAPDIKVLLAARFLTGIGLGGAFPSLLALTAENTPSGRRSTAVSILYAGMPAGGAVASLISAAAGPADWRLVFLVGGLAPIVLAPLLVFLLPESRELKAAFAQGLKPEAIHGLFGEGRAFPTILLWVASFLALVAMYIILNWLPTLLVGRGLSRVGASWVQMALNLAMIVGSVVTGFCMDRVSLSRAVFGAFASAAAALVVLGLAPVELGVSLVVGALVGATIASTQALLYAVAPATYPTEVRGLGVGASIAAGRVGSGVGPLLVGALLGGGTLPQAVGAVLIPTVLGSGLSALGLSLLVERVRRLGRPVAVP